MGEVGRSLAILSTSLDNQDMVRWWAERHGRSREILSCPKYILGQPKHGTMVAREACEKCSATEQKSRFLLPLHVLISTYNE